MVKRYLRENSHSC